MNVKHMVHGNTGFYIVWFVEVALVKKETLNYAEHGMGYQTVCRHFKLLLEQCGMGGRE